MVNACHMPFLWKEKEAKETLLVSDYRRHTPPPAHASPVQGEVGGGCRPVGLLGKRLPYAFSLEKKSRQKKPYLSRITGGAVPHPLQPPLCKGRWAADAVRRGCLVRQTGEYPTISASAVNPSVSLRLTAPLTQGSHSAPHDKDSPFPARTTSAGQQRGAGNGRKFVPQSAPLGFFFCLFN